MFPNLAALFGGGFARGPEKKRKKFIVKRDFRLNGTPNEAKQNAGAFKTSVGGQALMEGIMMRGPEKLCVAVRRPDGGIFTEVTPVPKHFWKKLPFVRGVCTFIDSLVSGYHCLMKSADISMPDAVEEETKFDRWVAEKFGQKGTDLVMAAAAVLGGMLALVLFLVLPTALVGLLAHFVPLGGWRALLEGVFKLAMLVGYMALVSKTKEIDRMFRYHGAEHKTIACYEAGKELTVENVRPCSRFHPRCGTSFLLIVILLSILVGAAIQTQNTLLRIALKLLLLPAVMGVGYEIIKLCGRYDNPLTHALSAPGLWLQRITTQEPDDGMIECAIAAVLPVLPKNRKDGEW